MLGRVDAQSRLNLFDTQSAQPITRGWYTFQYAQDYSTGTIEGASSLGLGNDQIERPNQLHHRFGAEYAASRNFSVAVQGEYVTTTDETTFTDFWNNPQVQLKQVVYRDCSNVVSGILGVQFQDGFEEKEVKEDDTKIYPGMLAFHTLANDNFLQGGFQFGLPLEGTQVYHFDWALGYGKFLYKDPCWGRCGHGSGCGGCGDCGGGCCDDCGDNCYGDCCDHCCHSCCGGGLIGWLRTEGGIPIRAVIAQVEVFGKHVIADDTYDIEINDDVPDGFGGTVFVDRITVDEERNNIDLTAGGAVLVGDGYGASSGVSIPLTGGEVRNVEFITSVWKTF
jgi:hypothetical protein